MTTIEAVITAFWVSIAVWLLGTFLIPFSFPEVCNSPRYLGKKVYYATKLSPGYFAACYIGSEQ